MLGRVTVGGRVAGTPGRAALPSEVLAALVAVTARRAHSDAVAVTGDVTVELDLSADPSLAALCAEVSPLVGSGFTAAVGGVRLVVAGELAELYAADDDELAQVAGQVDRALLDGTRDPSPVVSALDLASDADRALVAGFEGGDPLPAPTRLVHDLVDERARLDPDAPALTAEGTTMTYRWLVDRADALAGALVHAGVRPDEVVGVLGERSAELVTALLAVLKAGGAYLALSPDWPDARLTGLLDDARVRVVLADPDLVDRVPGDRIALPFDAKPRETAGPLPGDLSPSTLAYVSYTSGSTGEPKGVCVPHAAVSRLVTEPDWLRLGPDDVVLQAAPVAFDASTLEIWGPLSSGGRLALLPPGRVDPAELAAVVAAERVTVLWLTAGLFHQVVEHHLDRLAGVRHLIAGGDVISPDAVRRLLAAHPGLVFTNGYGPTENTTFTTCAEFRGSVGDGPLPIGRPIRGTRVRVLDPLGRPVPPGVVGDLHALGDGLARGYLGRPAATAAVFTPADGGGRQYRTGDLARWRADGSLDFLGRADDQVKINGYRVEPTEVAVALRAHPAVRDAVVMAEPGAGGSTRLAAYVVLGDDDGTTGPALRDWLRERVPEFLVPARVVALDAFPLTRNGKLDRDALPAAAPADPPPLDEAMTPQDALERFLCELWAEVLKLDSVGVDDDFFELGGHSLVAADLLGRLQQDFGVELPARKFYLSPTIAELSELAELDPLRKHVEATPT
ncbi:non-ribosomal peptide synthetase [Umezawaea sp. Da 62-37]|uniref:non-ribosomal peptide synthetase n=1 Tax=Umezawaea sp. Da 62-37 TaxID=3075927 RepID=UPI0028F6EA70|nr:non-ribosomal peptide synthetase [Umezawaea sp. Da 62-37]WNV85475.1 non-ribosomal peptide synthetase [Umezawaea sp. Da 62-37]